MERRTSRAAANLDFQGPAHLQKEFIFQTAGILPPNGIFFGFNTIKKVGEQAKKLGGKQLLWVTDEIMVQPGYRNLGDALYIYSLLLTEHVLPIQHAKTIAN